MAPGKKRGRPERRDRPQRLTTHLGAALKRRLRYAALRESRSAGDVIASALRLYFESRKAGKAKP